MLSQLRRLRDFVFKLDRFEWRGVPLGKFLPNPLEADHYQFRRTIGA